MTRVALLRRWKQRYNPLDDLIPEAGYEIAVFDDEDFDPAAADVVWIQGNANWFPRALSTLRRRGASRKPFTMTWHTEPLPFPTGSGFPQPRRTLRESVKVALRDKRATDSRTNFLRLRELHREGVLDLCVVSARSRQRFLNENQIPAGFVPLGYHPWLGHDMNIERDIDALFIGTLDDARHRRALRFLRSRGVNVQAAGSWYDGPTWGESRTVFINRAKMFLNVQRHAGQYSGLRMLLGMGNRSLVLSEPVHDPFPYVPGVHYVSSPLLEMPETILKYLDDDRSRDAIARAGHEFVTTQLTMKQSVAQILRCVEESLKSRK